MSMAVRYAGDFLSRKGVHWRCEILQESDSALPVGELTFPSDEPLSIEWEEKSLEETICPSKAVLTIESPGDRTYADLYTIKPGQIRLDVYRYVPTGGSEQKTLYWSGCLDPEFYEEPYDRGARYDVELTFSDFGILKRIPYDLSGRNSFQWIISSALQRSNIAGQSIGTHISTKFPGSNSPLTLSDLQMASENFFDEDGVANDYYSVVEGLLQPLALRMVQHNGAVWIYDINAIRALTGSYRKKINWNSTGQMMGVDNVFNNIKVTFSPYSSAELLDGKLEYDEPNGPEYTNITNDPPQSGPECYSYYIDYDPAHRQGYNWDYNLVGFTIFRAPYYNPKVKGIAAIGSSNRYFKIYPNLGGQESEGVIGGFRSQGHGPLTSGWTHVIGINPTRHQASANELALRTNRAYLPKLSTDDAAKFYLRIREEILVDPRYNPFEDASEDGNEGGNFDTFKSYASMAFVPVRITLYNESGTALYHYSNRSLVLKGHPDDSVRATLGSWVAGAGSWGDAFLAYYNPDDMLTDTGLGGWKANHQCFGKPWTTGRKEKKRTWHYEDSSGNTRDFYMFDSMKKIPDGQFIPYPPAGGYLEIEVFNGVWIFDDTERYSDSVAGTLYEDKYAKLRWQLYKVPEVSVVRRTLTYDKAETDDVEYSGVCNVDAKEPLELDTICGTTPVVCPSAKGAILRASTGEQIQTLVRADREDCPEHLLIGTLYSQFASRRTVLTGEADIPFGHLGTFYDDAQEQGVLFLMKGQVQNIIEDTTEAVFVEIRPDEYDGDGQ